MIDRWAGLRPKAMARDPLVGPLPDAERIIALTVASRCPLASHTGWPMQRFSPFWASPILISRPRFACPIILADTPLAVVCPGSSRFA